MGNSCKSRSRASCSQPAQVQHAEGKMNYTKKATPAATVRQTSSGDTRSWSRLQDEASLNPNAQEFYPQGLSKAQQNLCDATAKRQRQQLGEKPPPEGIVLGSVEGESKWMQYLTQRLQDTGTAAKMPSQPGGRQRVGIPAEGRADAMQHKQQLRTRVGLKVQNERNAGAAAPPSGLLAQSKATVDSGNNDFVLRTDDYMKLLKGGGDMPRGRQKMQARQFQQELRQPGSNLEPVVAPRVAKEDGRVGIPSAVSQLWSNAFAAEDSKNVGAGQSPSSGGIPKLPQDDTFVERMLLDRDLSEEAYWSDGGGGKVPTPPRSSALAPAAHRMRSRPPAEIRSYVMQGLSEELDSATALLLCRMQTLNLRMLKLLDGRASGDWQKRRFIIGLKEVFRRVKQGHVTALLVAPDVESCCDGGKLDDRIREVLACAYQQELPVIFALSRKRIGRALGMSLNISIMGFVDMTGTRDLCEKAFELAATQRNAWLDKRA